MFPKIAVVGAGITGVLTALACAQKGAAVDVYDLNGIPNKENNSWAYARLFRTVHDNSPHLEDLALRSEAFWKTMQLQTSEQLIHPVNVIRVNSEPTLRVLRQAYTAHHHESCITELDSTSLNSFFKIKNSNYKVLIGNDGLLLNANLIYKKLVDLMTKNRNIRLIPNSKLFANGLPSIREHKILKETYSTIIFSTSAPVKTDSKAVRKKFQYHIDIILKPECKFKDAILDLGDDNKTWCVPSLNGKKLKLSASEFSFYDPPSELLKRECREYLLDMIKAPQKEVSETVSSYYEVNGEQYYDGNRWKVDKENGCVLMEACNAQHFKSAPATANDISDHVFQ